MQTSTHVQGTPDVIVEDSITLWLTGHDVYENAAIECLGALSDGFKNGFTCTEIMAACVVQSELAISSRSFINGTLVLLKQEPALAVIIPTADDLGLFIVEDGRYIMKPGAMEVYDQYMAHVIANYKAGILVLAPTTESEPSASQSPPPVPTPQVPTPTPPIPESTPVPPQLPTPTAPAPAPTEEYYTIRIPADDGSNTTPSSSRPSSAASSSGSDYSFDLDMFKENRPMVIALTLASFIIIQGIAWYVRTYHKETLVPETVVDSKETDEGISYSSYEPLVLLNMVLNVIFPTLMICYAFRYIYIGKLKTFVKIFIQ